MTLTSALNIIQIGTNRADDHLASIVKNYLPDQIQNLILVEPFSIHNSKIQNCYTRYLNKLHIENIVITPEPPENGRATLWYHPQDLTHNNATELASLNKQHASRIVERYKFDEMQYLECPAMTINSLFAKYNLQHIDILYIDTEGYDDKIIYSIDFNKYRISSIFYEHLHIDKWALFNFLTQHNYIIEHSIPEDSYADKATLKDQ